MQEGQPATRAQEQAGILGLQAEAEAQRAVQAGSDMAQRLADLGWEQWRFSQEMARMGVEAVDRMLHCQNIEEVVEIQRDYWKHSIDRVCDEGRSMYRMSVDVIGAIPSGEETQRSGM
jgi:hypothetical protein